MSLARGSTQSADRTSQIKTSILLLGLGGCLYQFLEGFVVDVGGCPLGHLVAREIASKLHDGCNDQKKDSGPGQTRQKGGQGSNRKAQR